MSPDLWPVARPYSIEDVPAWEWRERRPVYVSRVAPCHVACPINGRIRDCLALVGEGDFERAWRLWVQDNPFPGVMGRICYAPCEESCNRREHDQAVAIRNVERFLGDYAVREGLKLSPAKEQTEAKVAIVGSGPAGLACAYHLALRGHQPTVFEALPVAGGMLRVGIPSFHLPAEILQGEIEQLPSLGIELRLSTPIMDVNSLFDDGYDAALLAIGAHQGQKPSLPGTELPGVLTGVELLHHVNMNEEVGLGKSVVVVGGGDVAIDVARTAARLGAKEIHLACLESRDTMPAHRWAVEEAEAEGVVIHPAQAVRALLRLDDRIAGVECVDVTFTEFGRNGHLTLETRAGSEHTLPCETVVFAIGQVPDTAFLVAGGEIALTARGLVSVDPVTLATGRPAVFAGGDAVPGCRTAAEALRFGKRAALSIDAYLSGESLAPREEPQPVTYRELNVSYSTPSERIELPRVPATERKRDFREVSYSGYDEQEARSGAGRCFSCGECFRCDNCRILCPDMAVMGPHGSHGYRFEYSYCKGCGICVRECPSNSIEMVPDEPEG